MSDRNGLTSLAKIIELFREMDHAFPLQYIHCFLIIAKQPGLSVTALAEQSGIKLPTVSRIIGALSDARQKGEGFGLIEIRLTDKQRRSKALFLSQKGQELQRQIEMLS